MTLKTSNRLYGWRGDYEKESRGVSDVSWKIHVLYWTFTMWSIDSCLNRIVTDQYHMTISRAHVKNLPTLRNDSSFPVQFSNSVSKTKAYAVLLFTIHAFNNSGRHLEFLIYDVNRGKISAAVIEL